MRDIVWTRGAEADLQEVYDDLEAFREGAGENFFSLIDASVELLRQFPEMAAIFEAPLRRLLLNDGRYGLFYVIEDRGIILHAVADLRRNPDELRRRFRKLVRGV
jgi:plasmid stabilization system protein ParE